jgi:hypothetical protein
MKRVFAIIMFLAACCLTSVAGPKVNSGDFEVPFTFERGNVIVKAKIKGKVPVEVVVATGSKNSLVDAALLEKYRLPGAYAGVGPATGRNDRIYVFSSVPDVTVGEAKASLSMRLGSMQELSTALGREIFGSLGADFFKRRTVRFDFQKRVLTFLDQSTAKALKDNSTGGDGDRRIVLEMIEPDNLYEPYAIVPVITGVTFDGKKAKVVLNTGMVTVISFSSSTAKKMGLTLPPEKSATRTDKIGSVHLGSYELKAVPVIISAKGTDLDHALEDPGAAFGTVFLQNFVSTFDFRHKRVILEPVQRRDNN